MNAIPSFPPVDVMTFGSDLVLRHKWFIPESIIHPCKLHLRVVRWLVDRYTQPGETIADPMAGIGSLLLAATMQRHVIVREIEPRWLTLLQQNATHITLQAGLFAGAIDIAQADAQESWGYQADHLLFSPPYGCSASTTPQARRMLPYKLHQGLVSYRERWQRFLAQPNAGTMGAVVFHYGSHPAQIGPLRGVRYWQAMRMVYIQARVALRPDGYMMLIIKDHIRDGQRVPTANQTITLCETVGFRLVARHQRHVFPLSLWQRRRKERGEPVVEEEDILVFQ